MIPSHSSRVPAPWIPPSTLDSVMRVIQWHAYGVPAPWILPSTLDSGMRALGHPLTDNCRHELVCHTEGSTAIPGTAVNHELCTHTPLNELKVPSLCSGTSSARFWVQCSSLSISQHPLATIGCTPGRTQFFSLSNSQTSSTWLRVRHHGIRSP